MEKNIPKTILYISFIPYGLVLLFGIYSAIGGINFFGMTYGSEGFILGMLAAFIFMCVFPIIPVCFIYQIAYLLRHVIKPLQNVSIKKYIAVIVGIVVIVAAAILFNTFKYDIQETRDGFQAREMLSKAEEKIEYNKSTYYMDGIFGIENIIHNTVLIDYDQPEIGLIKGSITDEYISIRLSKTTADSDIIRHMDNDYFVQSVTELSSPGKRMITLTTDEKEYRRTIAVILEMADGSFYYAEDLTDRNGGYGMYAGLDSLDGFAGTYSEETREMHLPKLSDLEPLG